jgi:NAD(P)-dependent dehydrogenase (short-subunit alcohol dehydrogenase family)
MTALRTLFDLSGRVALVTGGSRGLGFQVAEALGEFGARIALAARKPDELQAAQSRLAAQGVNATVFASDLRTHMEAQALTDKVMHAYGRIDILVNNAGTSWGAPAEDHTPEAWRRVMDLNVDGLFWLSQAVAKAHMIPHKSGRIINIASIAGVIADLTVNTVAYNTSKGAVIMLTRALAAEWGKYGITVNAIGPGWFPSRMTRGVLAQHGDELTGRTALGKLGGDDDLKGAALLLASDAGGHITGQTIFVDGGASIL